MNSIKKGYLPYLIGEIACCAAEVILFFFALYSDSLFAVIVSLVAIAATGIGIRYAYKKSKVVKATVITTERDIAQTKTSQKVMKEKTTVRAAYPLTVLSLILLCNPNVGIVDMLPDFIACFILARVIAPATERAPYFAEARKALVRLGWLNVGKIAGLLLIGYSRMQNAFGNDTSVVVVTVFSVAEFLLSVSATSNLFMALFRLGERTDMNATIAQMGKMPSSMLPVICYVFFGVKAFLNILPNLMLLTRISDDGVISTVAKGYAPTLVLSVAVTLIAGIAWCVIMLKYVKAIHKEGQFYNSISLLSSNENEERIRAMHKTVRMKGALTLLFVSTIMLIDIKFDNTGEINLLPNVIFGIIGIIAIYILRMGVSRSVTPTIAVGAVYSAVSLVSYLAESYFLYNYGYSALLDEGVAHSVYSVVEILSIAELALLTTFAVFIGRVLITFTYENTAIPPSDERYSRADADFHRAIKHRIIAFVTLTVIIGVARCVWTFSNGFARLVLNQQATATVMSAIPWMGALTTALTVLLIGFSYYLFTMLKEEVDMKYGGE